MTDTAESMTSFAELGLSPELLRAVVDAGYDSPTPIQREAIPLALKGIGYSPIGASALLRRNLLVYGPLCALALPGGWRLARGRAPGRWFGPALAAIAVAAVVALLLHLVVGAQDNLRWIAAPACAT